MTVFSVFDQGTPAPCPRPFNMAGYILSQASRYPDKPALEVYENDAAPSEIWTYRELEDAVLRTSGALVQLGYGPGHRILLRIGNSSDFPILFLAAIAIGAAPVPTSALLTGAETDFILKDLNPDLICFGENAESFETPVPRICAAEIKELRQGPKAAYRMTDPDELAYIIYTSGTSGTPKAVMHAHRAVWARRMMWEGWYGLDKDDRMMHAGAFNWTYTLGTGLCDPWAIGATSLIYTGPADRGIWARLAQNHKPSLFAAAPGVYRQVLSEPVGAAFSCLRHGLSAGEKLPKAVHDRWQSQTGKEIYEALGMSEISTFVSSSPRHPPKTGTAGRVQIGRRVAVLPHEGDTPLPCKQPGLLAVSRNDPGLMLGYRGAEEETAEKFRDEWFVTGDTVTMDKDGYITYLGRNDDMLNAGGYRVSPLEIENALNALKAVEESAAVEIEVKKDVFVIAVFYVANTDVNNDDLKKHCEKVLARYKCPRLFRRVAALPKGANNKLKRQALKTQWKS